MAIKVQGTTVIDDNRNFTNINSITFADGSVQTTPITQLPPIISNSNTSKLFKKLDNPNAYGTADRDFFGGAVAASENYIAVGAAKQLLSTDGEDGPEGSNLGKVYIYNSIGEFLYTIDNPNPTTTLFGCSLDIDGDYLVVGATGSGFSGAEGKAYVYNITTGQLIHTLNRTGSANPSTTALFGWDVAIRGNYVAVGAPWDSIGQNGQTIQWVGSAYVYNVTTGEFLYALRNIRNTQQFFGLSLDIHGNYIVVGAWYGTSAVDVFNVLTGQLIYTLNAPVGTNAFGAEITLHKNYLIVGASEGKIGFISASSNNAYVYNVTTGALLYTLSAPNTSNSYFGYSICANDDFIAIASMRTVGYIDTVNLYNISNGQFVRTIKDSDEMYNENPMLGYSMQFSKDNLVIGAPFKNKKDINNNINTMSGKVYIYIVKSVIELNGVAEFTLSNGITLRGDDLILQKSVNQGGLVHTLNNPNAYGTTAGDNFGASVAISGNYAIVGAPLEDDAGGTDSGKAYIFNVTTGEIVHVLNNPNAYSTSANDRFGSSVAISGNYAIVGAPLEDDAGGTDSGKAYIYDVTTGALLYTLNNLEIDFKTNNQFGFSVAISSGFACVGAPLRNVGGDGAGTVYVYDTKSGALLYTIRNANAYGTGAGDYFGFSVAIDGIYLVVGAPLEDDAGGTESGKAYVYTLFQTATGGATYINNPNAYGTSAGDYFGYSVAIFGNYVIVGAPLEDDAGGTDSGKAYVYNRTTNVLLYTLNNPNKFSTGLNDYFGHSVAISGEYVIVGAPLEDDASGTDSGKAYIYNVTTGALLHTLNNPNPYGTSAGDNFSVGRSAVAISGSYAIVGAYAEDDAGGTDSGKAYIFATKDLTYLDRAYLMVS